MRLKPTIRLLLFALLWQVPVVIAQTGTMLAPGQAVEFTIKTAGQVYTGELFNYTVRVIYRADQVAPDFPALIRDIRFIPFEQLHLSRPQTHNIDLQNGLREYVLSYPLQGINIVPHRTYTLDPVTLYWRQLSDGTIMSQTIQPAPVTITGYYSADVFAPVFQPLQPAIEDHYRIKQALIALLSVLALVYAISRIRRATSPQAQAPIAHADKLHAQFVAIDGMPRENLLAYERILLSLLFYYRQFSARRFWQTAGAGPAGIDLMRLKDRLREAYRGEEPDAVSILEVRDSLGVVFGSLQGEAQAESLVQLQTLQGTLRQRLRAHKWTFGRGLLGLLVSLLLLAMLIWPALWRDPDVRLYNDWVQSLPPRLFDSSMDAELGSVDVELLVQISEQQDILQQLGSDLIKSAYLYNFGTLVAKAYVAIIAAEDREQEEIGENEVGASRPSFEFPKQLLANAVRLAPLREDPRRNLELVIMLREAEKKDEESGQTQGELGPPLPGFSRDLNPVLF